MRNYLFIGDTHGDLSFVAAMCDIAFENNAEIIQVGDWGFIWPGGTVVKKLSAILEANRVTMRFIDGNHDWHSKIWERAPTREATEIEPSVIYQPRGSTYTDEDGTKFVFMGGAPSIDKGSRHDGVSWWATEEITDEDMEVGLAAGKCDVLVTHDAPQYPPGFAPKGTPEFRVASTRSMNNIKALRTALSPSLHVHGHWHHAYTDGVTRGLDCNWAMYPGDAYFLWSRIDVHHKESAGS